MTTMWISESCRESLESAGLATFDDVMSTTAGRCLRVLADRENWYLEGSRQPPAAVRPKLQASESDALDTPGIYLKKHRARTWRTRVAASLGLAPPASPGRIEAENAIALQSLGIDVMPLTAYGEKLHADGRLESFLLSEELEGYCELQDFITRRFPKASRTIPEGCQPLAPGRAATRGQDRNAFNDPGGVTAARCCDPSGVDFGVETSDRGCAARPPANGCDPSGVDWLRGLIVQVADIARRFHAAGFNHRDFYCCHFLVKEVAPGRCDVRLIDLQRVQKRRWFRRRWIVKDLAQLASMSPDEHIGRREKVLFLHAYLGVAKLRPQDKRLVRDILRKLASIRRRVANRIISEGIATRGVSEGAKHVPRLRLAFLHRNRITSHPT